LISREKLLQLYAAMVKSRMLAERTAKLAQGGKLPQDWEIGAGNEATLAGITADLRPEDTLSAPDHWMLGSLIDGFSLENVFGPFAAALNENGHSGARRNGKVPPSRNGSSSHAPVRPGLDFKAAVDAAKVHKAGNDGRIAIVYCRDSSPAEISGKQLEFVSRHNLPLVLLQYFSFTDRRESFRSARESRNGSVEALAFGVPRIAVDARDVLAVYRVASESISRARQGRGPTLIECVDQGLPAVSGAAARNQSSVADPVRAMASYLGKRKIMAAALKQQIESQICREIDAAMKHFVN
jgi:acetoin:2,6-dichlorophenolindophenol oxidoreductase subunit alpha